MQKYYFTFFLLILSSLYGYGQCSPDTTSPTISCPSNVTVGCWHQVPSLTPTVSDNCGGISLQTYVLTGATTGGSPATGIHDASSENFLAGTTTVTYYIEDSSGNSASCNFTVTINDYSAPLLICPSDTTTVNDAGQCSAVVNDFGFMSAWDNCSGITVTLEPGGLPPGSAFPVGTTTNTYTFTDLAGNSSSCTFDIIVTDEEDPSITCPINITALTDPGLCSATVSIPAPTATDNCGIASFTNDYNGTADASDVYPLGTTVVSYTVTDTSGRTATCTFNVTVDNAQTPVITLNGADPISLEACDTYTEYGATAVDNCLGDISGSLIIDDSNLDTNAVGSYSIFYTLYNGNGDVVAQEIRTVNIVDTTAPSLSLTGPNPLTVGDCSTYTELGAVATDPCFGDISGNVVVGGDSVNTSVLGTYIVTYDVTDDSGNVAAQITRTVNVEDVSGPDITLLGDNPLTLEACSVYTDPGATATDPCFGTDYTSDIVIDSSAVDTSTVGSYNVTYNVMDSNGNPGLEVIRVVEIVETTPPTITCPGDMNLSTDPGSCTALVNYTIITSDNCPGEVLVQTAGLASGSQFPIGTTTNSFEVTDSAGVTATCSFDITISDTEFPTVVCQTLSVQLDPSTGLASITAADVDNGSSDNCNFNLSVSTTNFDCSNIGDNTVTLTITDDAGNVSTCDTIVTITDAAENAAISISASVTEICIDESVTFTATPTDGGASPNYQWQINGVDVAGETGSTFTTTTLTDGDAIQLLMTSDLSVCASEVASNIINMSVSSFDIADAGLDYTNSICTETTITLSGNVLNAPGATGLWTVTSGQTSGFSFSDATDPNSTFTGEISETYVLLWSIDNPDPCPDSSDDVSITFIGCTALDFDGVDDNVTFGDNFNLNSAGFTIETWIKADEMNTNIQTIISKREASDLTTGYDLRLVNNYVSFHWNSGSSITSPFQLTNFKWYHIAVTFNGSSYTLYIDGVALSNQNGAAPGPNTVDAILGAMDQTLNPPYTPLNYFKGGMDELRIWDVSLTADEIRAMMNQEIEDDAGSVRGAIVPFTIGSLSWTNLIGYYQMNQSIDISDGNLNSNCSTNIDGLLRYMTTNQPESAPLPYRSAADGDWTNSNTWLFGSSQAIPNSVGLDGSKINWNIVLSSHNISTADENITLGGLIVENNTLTVENSDPTDGQSLTIADYLKIDGTIDLVGESQLLQDEGSILDVSSSGQLERDQQGTANLFNYNYWSSPVSPINTASNNAVYSVGEILYDGSDAANPLALQWTSNHDADGTTTPITLSKRWIYAYENYPFDSYAAWRYLEETGTILTGLGFTMKGSGIGDPETAIQNYVFKGKPHNGSISVPITPDFQALVGNPYPSAIDAIEFIKDNIPGVDGNPGSTTSIDGNLYFWEHYTTNLTHNLEEYEGGYATYNLTGGNAAISPPLVSDNGTPTKIPGQYIPVGQGFFVTASATGGSVTFNNDQRVFQKEAVGTSVFMEMIDHQEDFQSHASNLPLDNSNESQPIQRVRINCQTVEGSLRHLLLGFDPNNFATEGVDVAYDAPNTDEIAADFSWYIDEALFTTQGVGQFDITKAYPLSVSVTDPGLVEIALESLENFDENIDVYVHDVDSETYTLINTNNFSVQLNPGIYSERFYITFNTNDTLGSESVLVDPIGIHFLNETGEIQVALKTILDIEKVSLFNIIGQEIMVFEQEDFNYLSSGELRIPVTNISEGAYVIKVLSDSNVSTKKVIISNLD
ncbi:MAG: HYR domain-containing protein [Bacteroidia bacterium]|nr:HYR domain-containing protein [Bacteroidia bacterium]